MNSADLLQLGVVVFGGMALVIVGMALAAAVGLVQLGGGNGHGRR